MKQAIGYVRVSTDGQAEDGVSLEAQQERIQAWCLVNGYQLADLYVDAGLSGKRADNRPALNKALEDVCKRGGVLVVYSLARLARSTKDTLAIADRLERAGCDLASLSEKIDTTSAAGKMVFCMLAVLAEFERDLVSERTTCAMQYKRSQGERVGKIPYGFDLAEDGVNLVKNPSEQRALDLIQSLHKDGYSLRQIADQLNKRGVASKGGQPWKHSTVQRIVKRAA